ncbi:hypothetical protein [Streptomyces mirabilis]|uniref:hypothetical protein n=1 Tax=Streptomyces mirabilis TaxID=68239 RepID=UPI00352D145A
MPRHAARTGSLTPGKDADVILLRADDTTVVPVTDPAGTIVAAGHPGLVDTVLIAGRPRDRTSRRPRSARFASCHPTRKEVGP